MDSRRREKEIVRGPDHKYWPGLIVQLYVLVTLCVIANGIMTYYSQRRITKVHRRKTTQPFVEQVSEETIAAVKEYPAYKWLLRYWYEHADSLDLEYDVEFSHGTETERKAALFAQRNPQINLRYADEEQMESLPQEDQKLYAEIIYSWLTTRINQIKLAYKVDYLYCVVVETDTSEHPYEEEFFLFSAADPGAKRGMEYLQVYPIGKVISTDGGYEQARDAMREAVESARIREKQKRIDPEIDESGLYLDEYTFLAWVGPRAALIGVSLNLKEAYTQLNRQAWEGTLYAMLYQFVLLQAVMISTLQFVIKPIKKVQQNMRLYGKNKDSLQVRENLIKTHEGLVGLATSRNEIGELADNFMSLTEEVDEYVDRIREITAEKGRIEAELNLAAQIQTQMVPPSCPDFGGRNDIRLYAIMDPAKEVGGDFYDYFPVDEDHLVLVMADVSSKGVPAALFMVIAKALIKNCAQAGESPAQILTNVNSQLCEGNEAGFFVTVWLAIVELSTGKGVAANAGHEHPAICHRGGEFELVRYKHDPCIAMLEGVQFHEHGFELEEGDRLFVYTDGVPEAANTEHKMFGTDRMLETLNKDPHAQPEMLLKNLRREIEIFETGTDQFDDITMMCFAYREGDAS